MNELNPYSPIPLYHQLAEVLLERIKSGEFPPGSRIPSETTLSESYGIGRPTARQATDVLVRKQILIRKRGAGTFVQNRPEEVDLFSLAGTISSFHKKGILLKAEIVEPIKKQSVQGDPENPFSESEAFFLSRISRVDGLPVLFEDIYLHPKLFAGIDRFDLTGRSLSQIVDEQYFMRPIGGKQNFRVFFPKGEKARLLAVHPYTPILLVKRFLNFKTQPNAIYSELYCRTDQFVFSQTLGGMTDEGQRLL